MSSGDPGSGQDRQRNNNQNYNADPEATSAVNFSSLSEMELKDVLCRNQALSGFLLDENSRPIRSNYQVAVCKDGGYYSPAWVHEENLVDMETINTRSERESNYVHHGWSLSAISIMSPWSASRLESLNRMNQGGEWITQRTVLQRLFVKIPLEELKPNPDFNKDIQRSLQLPTRAEKVQAIYQVLRRWGDVIPLVYGIGISLSLTDTEGNLNSDNEWWRMNYKMSKTARITTKGGTASVIHKDGFGSWVTQELQPQDWRVIQVIEVVPTLQLLDTTLQKELSDLHSTVISFDRSNQIRPTEGLKTWSDVDSSFKTISSVTLRCGGRLDGILLAYRNGSQSDHRGGSGGSKNTFALRTNEHISGMLTWCDATSVCGIQFVTTDGRLSPHYGGVGGTPTWSSCAGSVLGGLSGCLTKVNDRDMIGRMQGIWRHDVTAEVYKHGDQYAEYIGGAGGIPFNDWEYAEDWQSTSVSHVEIHCGSEIEGLQFTYVKKLDGGVVNNPAPHRGERGGTKKSFRLDPDEHIVSVSGARDDRILVRLCFMTNKGRASEVFGGNGETSFMCQPRANDGRTMRLGFVAGKCGDRIDGLLFIWVPI